MTSEYGYALFDTGIGRCAVAWGPGGVVAVQLPEVDDAETVAHLTSGKRLAGARNAQERTPPPRIHDAIDAMAALLDGEAVDLSIIELDMAGVPPFHRRVYELARTIPRGETISYGDLATHLGSPGAARAVGQALRRNPFAIVVPCHRVVAAGGKLGGFSANGGVGTKIDMLSREAPLLPPPPQLVYDIAVAAKQLAAVDPVMAALIDAVGPCQRPKGPDGPPELQLTGATTTFAALSRAVVYQQLHGRAAAAIYGRLRSLFPPSDVELRPEDIVAAPDEALLGAGLSRAKFLSIRDLARRALDGSLPTLSETGAMDDEAIVEELSQVRGIGRWTSEMFLIFTLGRPDVLPVGDLGVRKGFALAYRAGVMATPKELLAFGERWRPFRSLASWYLWQALELEVGAPDR